MMLAASTAFQPLRPSTLHLERPRYARWAVRAPTSRQRWQLVAVEDLRDDRPIAEAGWNVVGPVLDLSVLELDELVQLARLARRGADELERRPDDAARLGELLGRLPRLTGLGYDIDVRDDLRHTEAGVLAEAELVGRVMRGEGRNKLRHAYTRGRQGGGAHLELGPVADDVREPDLLAILFRRAEALAERVGLVRRARKPSTTWTLPEWAAEAEEAGTDVRAFLDLTRLHHVPGGRQGILRPLGGLSKDGTTRKTLAPGSTRRPSPITRELLAEAPPAPPERERSARRRERVEVQLPEARSLPGLTAWAVEQLRRPCAGGGHTFALELAGTLQLSGLVRDEWGVEALAAATGRRVEARHDWLSTRARVRQGLPVASGPALARRLGRAALFELAEVLQADLAARGVRLGWLDVLDRLGLLGGAQRSTVEPLAAELERRAGLHTPGSKDADVYRRLARRVRASLLCGRRGIQHEACGCCGLEGALHVMRDQELAVCPRCARRRVDDALALWPFPADGVAKVAEFQVPDRAAARAVWKAFKTPPDQGRPLRLLYPRDGGWRLVLVHAVDPPPGMFDGLYSPFSDMAMEHGLPDPVQSPRRPKIMHPRYLRPVGLPELRDLVARALLGRLVEVGRLVEAGEVGAAADLMRELHRRKDVDARCVPPALRWPSDVALRDAARERVAIQREADPADEQVCPCPEEVEPTFAKRFQVRELPSRTILHRGLRCGVDLGDVAALERGAERAKAAPPPGLHHVPVQVAPGRWRAVPRRT